VVGNGLDARYLSHDPEVVKKYLADRQVHDKISPRLGKFIATPARPRWPRPRSWRTPTLLMYAGADRLVNPAGSRAFAENAPTHRRHARHGDRAVLRGALPRDLQRVDSEPVFDTLKAWLARFALF
jgi:alpha-beta hydrolase superfamily lysophospholipase